VGGALLEAELLELAEEAGLSDGRIVKRFESFKGTASLARVKASRHPHGANFYARK